MIYFRGCSDIIFIPVVIKTIDIDNLKTGDLLLMFTENTEEKCWQGLFNHFSSGKGCDLIREIFFVKKFKAVN